MAKRKRGRPLDSRNVKVTPEFRQNPDIRKMGLVFMAAAKCLLEKEQMEGTAQGGFPPQITNMDNKGDDMT